MSQHIPTFLSMVCAWLLWSQHYTLEALQLGNNHSIAYFGLGSCLMVTYLSARINQICEDREPYVLSWRSLYYIPWLLWQIVKANLEIARIVLTPKLVLSPRLLRIKAHQKTDLARAIYANSISLTPGTITLDTRGNHFVVYALTEKAAAELLTGAMDRKVAALERGLN